MKLLKLLTAIVIASAATFTATAQDKAYFGVRAAYDMCTSTKNSYMTSWGSGFSVGGVYFAPFGKLTFFQPGLLFYATTSESTALLKMKTIGTLMTVISVHTACACRSISV